MTLNETPAADLPECLNSKTNTFATGSPILLESGESAPLSLLFVAATVWPLVLTLLQEQGIIHTRKRP
ncbi:hypothetical protein [Deinococcus misasensis]|uniref:hypothetical protein n=1 Tax=Deinococcus misasensis TaxID=392413 RepID=UPI000B0579D0|nr:hypothetical protein [Deinococcus misasensis]